MMRDITTETGKILMVDASQPHDPLQDTHLDLGTKSPWSVHLAEDEFFGSLSLNSCD